MTAAAKLQLNNTDNFMYTTATTTATNTTNILLYQIRLNHASPLPGLADFEAIMHQAKTLFYPPGIQAQLGFE